MYEYYVAETNVLGVFFFQTIFSSLVDEHNGAWSFDYLVTAVASVGFSRLLIISPQPAADWTLTRVSFRLVKTN